jgi:hypothetical protein
VCGGRNTLVDVGALDGAAGELLGGIHDGSERVSVVRAARQRFRVTNWPPGARALLVTMDGRTNRVHTIRHVLGWGKRDQRSREALLMQPCDGTKAPTAGKFRPQCRCAAVSAPEAPGCHRPGSGASQTVVAQVLRGCPMFRRNRSCAMRFAVVMTGKKKIGENLVMLQHAEIENRGKRHVDLSVVAHGKPRGPGCGRCFCRHAVPQIRRLSAFLTSPLRRTESVRSVCAGGGGLNRSTQHFILNGKDGVYGDVSRISSRFHCGRESGVVGSLAKRGVAESDRASVW